MTASAPCRCGSDPRIRPADAEQLCAEPYPSRAEAVAVARQLRASGWVVVEHSPAQPPQRPDGTCMVASVYHPRTYESPGDVLMTGP